MSYGAPVLSSSLHGAPQGSDQNTVPYLSGHQPTNIVLGTACRFERRSYRMISHDTQIFGGFQQFLRDFYEYTRIISELCMWEMILVRGV